MSRHAPIDGAGLGLRRALTGPLQDHPEATAAIDFFEIAPENWIGVGGRLGATLRGFTERHRFACHGLSLSLGGPAPLDQTLLARIRRFMDQHGIAAYSEHLAYCSDEGHLYDLLPIPFTDEAVRHTAARIRTAQDILGRRIAVENASYYAAPGARLSEIDFVNAVLAEADCDLLLDVNNIYVNATNHGYDAEAFLAALPGERIAWIHVAGHRVEPDALLIDTHGMPVCDPVWRLLAQAYARFGPRPTLVERDFNFPPLEHLVAEVETVRALQRAAVPDAAPSGLAHG
ncbi:DUF692 domain-containing protein [Dokdonella koreensis]|uniref:UPF0276 protein I596_1745 n=1 Tax=Dokdonella koreensis DS-123 TaxID=1300342 RepID=A0A160DTR5_9GAMM|nr:DUF692 domain-containing protein [Dokdonella koreensis]ANB17769.1 Hypothetical protein I596_1745 [Dokdonella koreensis DS-123]